MRSERRGGGGETGGYRSAAGICEGILLLLTLIISCHHSHVYIYYPCTPYNLSYETKE